MTDKMIVSPEEIRCLGNIASPKNLDDFTNYLSELSLSDGVYTLSYGGTYFNVNVSPSTVTLGGTVAVTVTLKENGVPVEDASVALYEIYNLTRTKLTDLTTDENGQATYTYTASTGGNIGLVAVYDGTDSNVASVTVNKLNTGLTITPPTLVYTDWFYVVGGLKDSNDNPINGKTVTLIWNDGTEHTATTTTSYGLYSFNQQATTATTEYTFKVVFAGDANYNASETAEISVELGKETSVLQLTTPSTSSVTITGDLSLAGTLKESDTAITPPVISGATVKVYKGASYATKIGEFTTDSDGVFSGTISGTNFDVGSTSVRVIYEGATYYTESYQDITVVKEESGYDGMSLSKTAGKQILSYVDYSSSGNTEYCTVTAQLLDGASSATISGVPVVFGAYQNDVLITGSEQSVNTDSNGQASYTYTSQGLGDIVVKAVPDERSLLIQTYELHDYYGYRETGSHTFSSTSTEFSTIFDLNGIGDCEITGKLNMPNMAGTVAFAKSNSNMSNSRWTIGVDSLKFLMATSLDSSGNSTNHSSSLNQQYTYNTDLSFKFVREGTSISLRVGSSPVYTGVYVSDIRYLGLLNWNNVKTITYKDLIVKKL